MSKIKPTARTVVAAHVRSGPVRPERLLETAAGAGRPNGGVKLGPQLRACRLRQHLSLTQLAKTTGLTKGFISLVERDLTSASVASLIKLCAALQISVGSLFEPPKTNLVRAAQRPQINFGGQGLTEYLLTPAGNNRIQVIQSLLQPGGGSGDEPYSLAAEGEFVHVLSGSIGITIQGETYLLQAGDSLSFSARDQHSWRNASGNEGASVLWILAPSPW